MGTLSRPRSEDRQTDLFGSTELIVPGVLFKTMNVRALKKQWLSRQVRLRWALPSNLIVK